LRDYELVLIVSPEVDDEAVGATVERVQRFIAEQGGEVKEVTPWGRRRLAYPISRHIEGSYVIAQVSLEPTSIGALDENLQLSEDVIRHLVIRPGA
jgi:small subunit ribosomal protein S6